MVSLGALVSPSNETLNSEEAEFGLMVSQLPMTTSLLGSWNLSLGWIYKDVFTSSVDLGRQQKAGRGKGLITL